VRSFSDRPFSARARSGKRPISGMPGAHRLLHRRRAPPIPKGNPWKWPSAATPACRAIRARNNVLRFLTVYDVDVDPGRRLVAEAQAIFRESFHSIAAEADRIPVLVNQQRQLGYDVRLVVAERANHVAGFALVLYFPEASFAYLDYIATARDAHSGGL